jgi:hypothetical protein
MLPNDFFDEDQRDVSQPAIPVITSSTLNSSKPVETSVNVEMSASAIPAGFFDDPVQDMQVRGIDVKKVMAKKEEEIESNLQTFFGEVKSYYKNIIAICIKI